MQEKNKWYSDDFKRVEFIIEKSKKDNLFEMTVILFFLFLSSERGTFTIIVFALLSSENLTVLFQFETNPTDLGNCFHLTDYN